jgi:peptide-methionine (R)-S-oxide reductase
LTKSQYYVLREKGTDPRHLTVAKGGYDDLYDKGTYSCAACGVALYTSAMKFDCGCGWPGFWTNISKTVREEPDKDGLRVEIVCNACNSHLGHVFRNEGFKNPEPNERHCVNSTSLKFTPAVDGGKEETNNGGVKKKECGS